MKAPDFSLIDQDNKTHTLSDYRGKWVVLYFYPKDNTPGCTKEACGFRDEMAGLKKHNAVILGVSADSVVSHKKFVEMHRLSFPLLSDPERTVIKAYKAWGKKKFLGKEFEGILRITYLINPEGEIAKIYEKVKPENHAQEIAQDIQTYKNSR